MLYIFAGPHRKGDVGSFLHALGHVDTLLQFDLQRSSEHDLTKEGLWQHIFHLLGDGEWILIASPPCETFSRVRHRRPGSKPLGSSFYPLPWLSNVHQQQVAQANYFVDQTVTACQLAWQYFLEHPEDLLATPDQEVPASIWQFPSIRELQVNTKAITFAVFQCAFEAPTSKPTRFLTNLSAFTQQPPAYATWPRFDAEHRYVGPLPPRCPHGGHDQVLAGRSGRVWATSAAAAYPPLMCEWIAHAVLTSAAHGGLRSASHSSGPEAKASLQDAGGSEAVVSEAVDRVEAVSGAADSRSAGASVPQVVLSLEAVGSAKAGEASASHHGSQSSGSAQDALPKAVSSLEAVGSVEAGVTGVHGSQSSGSAQDAVPKAVSSLEAVGSVEAGVIGAPRRFAKAEDFAEAISSARTPTRAEVATLFGLLPHETPPRSTMYSRRTPSSFTTGLFRKGGGLIGLRTACRQFPHPLYASICPAIPSPLLACILTRVQSLIGIAATLTFPMASLLSRISLGGRSGQSVKEEIPFRSSMANASQVDSFRSRRNLLTSTLIETYTSRCLGRVGVW